MISSLPLAAATGYDSTTEALIRTLSNKLIVLAVTIALLFEVILLSLLVRYRNSGTAAPPEYNSRLFVPYVLAVGVVLLFVGVASVQTLVALEQQESNPAQEDAVQVDVVAEQFAWTFEYADDEVTSRGTLVIPANETIHLRLTSRDVIHSFHAPDLGLKQDANPGEWTSFTFTPTSTGEYRLFCAEFCGVGHSNMLGSIRVVDSSEYEDWLDEQRDDSTSNRSERSAFTSSNPPESAGLDPIVQDRLSQYSPMPDGIGTTDRGPAVEQKWV